MARRNRDEDLEQQGGNIRVDPLREPAGRNIRVDTLREPVGGRGGNTPSWYTGRTNSAGAADPTGGSIRVDPLVEAAYGQGAAAPDWNYQYGSKLMDASMNQGGFPVWTPTEGGRGVNPVRTPRVAAAGMSTKPASTSAAPDYLGQYQQQIDALQQQINGMQGGTVPGAYQSPYQAEIDDLYARITGRGPFAYDYTTDPQWQAYAKQYTREGQRALQDTMGQYAAMTGGMPSTAALGAGQQAQNYYTAQMSDKIPELYQAAYDMYLNEGNQMRSDLNTLLGMDDTAYSRWAADRQWQYNTEQDEYERQLAMAQLQAGYGDLSGLEGLGVDLSNYDNKVYAYGDDGSTYDVGSYKGQYFIANAVPGQTMRGGDGSTWTKNADGSVTITTQDGRTYSMGGEGTAATGGYGYGGGGGGGGNTIRQGAIDALLGGLGGGQTPGYTSIYDQMRNAGITNEGDAYAWLLANDYSSTEANKLAGYFAGNGSTEETPAAASRYGNGQDFDYQSFYFDLADTVQNGTDREIERMIQENESNLDQNDGYWYNVEQLMLRNGIPFKR